MTSNRFCTALIAASLTVCGFAVSAQVPAPHGPTGSWRNVFDDEFNASTLDTTKWLTHYWYKSTVADAYMTPSNIRLSNGVLTMTVTDKPGGSAANGTSRPYTGSMINTYGKFRFTYGVFEVRAQVPAGGQGIDGGAFLINDSGPGRDVWPPEIDLFEVLSASPTLGVMTYHWKQSGVHRQSGGWFKQTNPDFSKDFHVFTLDWEPAFIKWYIDGVERFSYTNRSEITSLPMYIVIDPSVCGNAPGTSWCTRPTNMGMFPAHMNLAYVRVWQH